MRNPYAVVAYASWWALILVWLPAYFMHPRARESAMRYPAWQIVATLALFYGSSPAPRAGDRRSR